MKKIRRGVKYGALAAASVAAVFFAASLIRPISGYEKLPSPGPAAASQAGAQAGLGDFYFIKDIRAAPKVSAEAYYVGDLDTGEKIASKGDDKIFPIASVSKLMTALVSEKTTDQNAVTTVTARAVATEGENGDLRAGEKIKVGDLVYPMLLESSNDAAEALADADGRSDFIAGMNEEAKELGLASTSFEDPSGLSAGNRSTAFDLFKFAAYLKANKPDILALTTLRSWSDKVHTWFNTSQFLGQAGYEGGKRGYIDESLQTAVSAFALPLGETGMRNVGIVVLRSQDRYKDVESILSYLKKNIYYGSEADADAAWVKEKQDAAGESEPDFVTMVFGGDIMLDRGVRNSVNKNFNGDYSALFQNLPILKQSDIAFANLEGPASDQGADLHNLYSFRMDPSVVPALKGAGFSALSVANNHVGDWGLAAYEDTLARLKENEILPVGGGENKGLAEQPQIIEKYGMKIGFLGFSDKGPNYLAVKDNQAGLLLASDPDFDQIVQNAAKQVDYLVVSFHFGEEYEAAHNSRQTELAHRAVDDGAKIVVGAHPHVVQDFETYKNGFIAYSLGNLVFDQYFSPSTMQGMLLSVKLWRDGSLTVNKNIVELNKAFQPEKIIKGKDEIIKFPAPSKTQ